MSDFHDFDTEPIGGGNPYHRCVHCKISVPQINGKLEGHLHDCPYRLVKEKEKDETPFRVFIRNPNTGVMREVSPGKADSDAALEFSGMREREKWGEGFEHRMLMAILCRAREEGYDEGYKAGQNSIKATMGRLY